MNPPQSDGVFHLAIKKNYIQMKELKHLNKYFYKYRVRLLLGIVFVIISSLFAIFPAQVVRHAFNAVKEAIDLYKVNNGSASNADLYTSLTYKLFLFGMLIILMALIKGIFTYLKRQTIIVMSRLIEYDLKNEVYEHYQKLNLSFYRKNNTGDLMARISEDVGRVRMYVGPAIMYTIDVVVLFIVCVWAMLNVNVELTMYVLLPLPLLSLSIYYVNRIISKKSEEVQRQLSALSTFVQEAFSGIRVIKSFVKEDASVQDFEKESEFYKNQSLGLVKVNALFSPLMLILIGLSTILGIYVGGKQVIAGTLSVGNIAEFIIYIYLLTWPVASIGYVTSMIQRAAVSQKRLNEFLSIQPEIFSPENGIKEIDGAIEFKNVSFIYPHSGIRALNNVSFTINKGQSLAILGKTGSGKSTVANLLTRMYDTTSGEVLIDQRNINQFDLGSLRNQIGYVPQEVFLFSDSISNNISFGLSEPEKNNICLVEQAAKDASIYESIMAFPEKFQTRIGERGITLSGGQKQRLSIARAIIKSPKILIFDDCLSAVDTETEQEILSNLKRLMHGRTSVIISHRVSTVKNADTILVLNDGNIVEEGNHSTLLAKNGYYMLLYEKQLLEEEKTALDF